MTWGSEPGEAVVTRHAAATELIYDLSLRLDARDFGGYLERCTPDFRYSIGAHSPELRKAMIWLDLDKPGLASLFETLPRHHSDHALLSRHVTVYKVEEVGDPGGSLRVVSALQVFRTLLDGGATALYAVGKIFDTVILDGGTRGARLARRRIELDTRMLGIGTHLPL